MVPPSEILAFGLAMAREENMENRAMPLKLLRPEVAHITSAHISLSKTRHVAGMCVWKS